jgi:hypothetical protein
LPQVVFDLVLVHVDESQVWSIAEEQRQQLLDDLQAAVKAAGFHGAVAITPLQAVVDASTKQQLQRLQACLAVRPRRVWQMLLQTPPACTAHHAPAAPVNQLPHLN